MSKLVTLTVAAGAYVLGAKAGRERYEQISTKAKSLWSDPKVQQKKNEAMGLAKDTAGKAKDKAAKTANNQSKSDTVDVAKPPAPAGAVSNANSAATKPAAPQAAR